MAVIFSANQSSHQEPNLKLGTKKIQRHAHACWGGVATHFFAGIFPSPKSRASPTTNKQKTTSPVLSTSETATSPCPWTSSVVACSSVLFLLPPTHCSSLFSVPLVVFHPPLFFLVLNRENALGFPPLTLSSLASGSGGNGNSFTSSVPYASVKVPATENLAASFRDHTGHSNIPHASPAGSNLPPGFDLGVVWHWRADSFLKPSVYYAKTHKMPDLLFLVCLRLTHKVISLRSGNSLSCVNSFSFPI